MLMFPRCVGMSGRLHEHSIGTDGGVRERTAEEQVWRRFHQGQQWCVAECISLNRWLGAMLITKKR